MDVVNVTCEAAAAPPCGPAGEPAAQDALGGGLFEALLARFAAVEAEPAAAGDRPRASKAPENGPDESASAEREDESRIDVVPWMVMASLPSDAGTASVDLDSGTASVDLDSDPAQDGAVAGVAAHTTATSEVAVPDADAIPAYPAGEPARSGQPSPVAWREDAMDVTLPLEAAPLAGRAAHLPEAAGESVGDAEAPAAPAETVTDAGQSPGAAPAPVRPLTNAARALARAVQSATAEQPQAVPAAQAPVPAEGRAAAAILAAGDEVVRGGTGSEVRAGVSPGETPQAPAKAANQSNAAAEPAAWEIAVAAPLARAEAHTGGAGESPQREGPRFPGRDLLSSGAKAAPAPDLRMVVETPGGRLPTAAPAPSPAPPPMPDAPVDPALQIVRALRIQTADGVSEAVIRLRPAHLGDVRISLTVERGGVTAVVHAERADVRAQILANADSLKECLASQGLRLDEFTVREDGRKGESGQQAQEQAPRRYRRPPARAFELAAEE